MFLCEIISVLLFSLVGMYATNTMNIPVSKSSGETCYQTMGYCRGEQPLAMKCYPRYTASECYDKSHCDECSMPVLILNSKKIK